MKRGRNNREKRRETATERAEGKAGLDPSEQLKRLDDRLGVGVGAARERARLRAALGMEKQ